MGARRLFLLFFLLSSQLSFQWRTTAQLVKLCLCFWSGVYSLAKWFIIHRDTGRCLEEEFYSLKIRRHPRGAVGAGLVFIGNFFLLQNKTKIPAMDPKHLINTYLCVFSLSISALVFMSASAILQYKTNHQENCNKKTNKKTPSALKWLDKFYIFRGVQNLNKA